MLQVTGHGKDVFDQQYQSAITEFITREKKSIKRWDLKYKPQFEEKRKEHEKRYLSQQQPQVRTLGTIKNNSEPTFRCIGWGVTKFDKRNADVMIKRGGLSHENDGEEYYSKPPQNVRSVHGRTKALSTAFYDTNGVYCFGDKVISKQGSEIEKNHEREMMRIENLRRRMGMEPREGILKGGEKKEQQQEEEKRRGGGNYDDDDDDDYIPTIDGEIDNLSTVSDPIEDLVDEQDMKKEEKEEIEHIPNLPLNEVKNESDYPSSRSVKSNRSQRSSRSTLSKKSQRSQRSQRSQKSQKSQLSQRSQRSQRSQSARSVKSTRSTKSSRSIKSAREPPKDISAFQRALKNKAGKKKMKKAAFTSYSNPLYPRFAKIHCLSDSDSDSDDDTVSVTSKRSGRSVRSGKRPTPRHEAVMRKLNNEMTKSSY